MISELNWRAFRDYLRSVRLTGVPIKFIGRKSRLPMFVTGVPILGNKIYVGEITLAEKDFVNVTHLTTSFSIDGVLVSQLYTEGN